MIKESKAQKYDSTNAGEMYITIEVPPSLVVVEDRGVTIRLPARPLVFDATLISEQLASPKNGMSVRDANRMTDEVLDFMYRQFALKALNDLVR